MKLSYQPSGLQRRHVRAALAGLALVILAGCNQIPGNISSKSQPAGADPAPPLTPVIHCAPDSSSVAQDGQAGAHDAQVASCTPPTGVQKS